MKFLGGCYFSIFYFSVPLLTTHSASARLLFYYTMSQSCAIKTTVALASAVILIFVENEYEANVCQVLHGF